MGLPVPKVHFTANLALQYDILLWCTYFIPTHRFRTNDLQSSIKVKDEFGKRSIAHFYRDCTVWPRLNPSMILAPSEQSIRATTTKRLFMGGTGEAKLTAALFRPYFIAGTQVSVNVSVQNDTKKVFKSLSLTLYRSTVVFKRRLSLDSRSRAAGIADPDECQTATTRKAVAASTLEMAQGFPRGHASTSGWWPGISSGERSDFSHFLLLPVRAIWLPMAAIDLK
jgi:hypothetical protein